MIFYSPESDEIILLIGDTMDGVEIIDWWMPGGLDINMLLYRYDWVYIGSIHG